MLLNLCLGCTTDGRSIPFRCLLQLLVQGHQCPLLCFVETLQFRPGMLKDQEPMWIRNLHSCRCCSGRQVVRRYHNSRCREALEAFLRTSRLRTIFSVVEVSEYLGQGICIVLYCTTSLNIWCTDGTRLIKVLKMEVIVKSV
jgi:hypothetical protein